MNMGQNPIRPLCVVTFCKKMKLAEIIRCHGNKYLYKLLGFEYSKEKTVRGAFIQMIQCSYILYAEYCSSSVSNTFTCDNCTGSHEKQLKPNNNFLLIEMF